MTIKHPADVLPPAACLRSTTAQPGSAFTLYTHKATRTRVLPEYFHLNQRRQRHDNRCTPRAYSPMPPRVCRLGCAASGVPPRVYRLGCTASGVPRIVAPHAGGCKLRGVFEMGAVDQIDSKCPPLGSASASSGQLGTPRKRAGRPTGRQATASDQHAQSAPLAVQLGFCASSGRAWRLWAARVL